MREWASLWRRAEAYAASGDPLTRASNMLALIVASNQPFYPLYVWGAIGRWEWALLLTFLSTPFFLAAPLAARLAPGPGRLFFPLVGALNTYFSAHVFGQASGVEAFLAPCLIVAALSCRAPERVALACYFALVGGLFLILHNAYGAPLAALSATQSQALASLNAYSAGVLCLIASWTLSAAWAEREKS